MWFQAIAYYARLALQRLERVECLRGTAQRGQSMVEYAIVAALIAVSRVGVRAHYPSDVGAGVFVGSAFTYLYAHALGRHGVAFQVQPDGSLRPKTSALRSMLRKKGGGRRMLEGVRDAYVGPDRKTKDNAAAVEKP